VMRTFLQGRSFHNFLAEARYFEEFCAARPSSFSIAIASFPLIQNMRLHESSLLRSPPLPSPPLPSAPLRDLRHLVAQYEKMRCAAMERKLAVSVTIEFDEFARRTQQARLARGLFMYIGACCADTDRPGSCDKI